MILPPHQTIAISLYFVKISFARIFLSIFCGAAQVDERLQRCVKFCTDILIGDILAFLKMEILWSFFYSGLFENGDIRDFFITEQFGVHAVWEIFRPLFKWRYSGLFENGAHWQHPKLSFAALIKKNLQRYILLGMKQTQYFPREIHMRSKRSSILVYSKGKTWIIALAFCRIEIQWSMDW